MIRRKSIRAVTAKSNSAREPRWVSRSNAGAGRYVERFPNPRDIGQAYTARSRLRGASPSCRYAEKNAQARTSTLTRIRSRKQTCPGDKACRPRLPPLPWQSATGAWTRPSRTINVRGVPRQSEVDLRPDAVRPRRQQTRGEHRKRWIAVAHRRSRDGDFVSQVFDIGADRERIARTPLCRTVLPSAGSRKDKRRPL